MTGTCECPVFSVGAPKHTVSAPLPCSSLSHSLVVIMNNNNNKKKKKKKKKKEKKKKKKKKKNYAVSL